MYGNTFTQLYMDVIADKLENPEPSAEEKQILNHLMNSRKLYFWKILL